MSILDKLLGSSEKVAMLQARAARVAAAVALGRSADPAAIMALLDQLADERDWPVRHKLHVALTRQCRRHRDHGVVVAAAAAARDDATRQGLVDALTAAKSPAAFGLWVAYFVRHELPAYRSCAAMGLRRLADPRATPYLLDLARDAAPARARSRSRRLGRCARQRCCRSWSRRSTIRTARWRSTRTTPCASSAPSAGRR